MDNFICFIIIFGLFAILPGLFVLREELFYSKHKTYCRSEVKEEKKRRLEAMAREYDRMKEEKWIEFENRKEKK